MWRFWFFPNPRVSRYDSVVRPFTENVTVPTYTPILKASQKIEFLQELREYLMLSPEEYRLLVRHVLRRHTQVHLRRGGKSKRRAA
jgi:hypothetical protein